MNAQTHLLQGSQEPSLLDVLPSRGSGNPSPQPLRLKLDPEACAALASLSADAAAERLCAALAWVEARLTGTTQVQATLAGEAGIGQGMIQLDASAPADRLRLAVSGMSNHAGSALTATPWAVLAEGTQDAGLPEGVSSTWQLRRDGHPFLNVAWRPPLGEDAVDLLATCVLRVLPAMLGDPGMQLSALDVLEYGERQRQLVEWNATAIPRNSAETVHGRFTAICEVNADATAVVDGTQALTYAQLQRRADALARRLHMSGVRPGTLVAVAMRRSVNAIVGMLGVLKAGAAYLPLDTSHPRERLAFMLAEAGVRVALVEDTHAAAGLPASVLGIVANDRGGDVGMLVSRTDDIVSRGDSLAYVMYTSGSTGTPKGVEIRHRSILRLVCHADYIELGRDTRMLHAAPLGFDASTLELWGALLNGGCVVVHPEALPTATGLARTIGEHRVTTAWLTASLFNAVVDEDPRLLAGLRELLIGGEALSVEHVRRMRRAAPALRLRNGYGPTECTTFTCTHLIGKVDDDAASIPIGRPIVDTQVYVLNAQMQPVPVGVQGELYVGGEGLARGYLNRPDLTSERFVPHLFGEPGERLYRTGDHVRYRADGTLEFVGRTDTQVKIRGFRIELGEIEAAMARHPAIRSCVVVAQGTASGEKQLVAYYVPEGEAADARSLPAYLSEHLPEFMRPSRYVAMDRLPVTANGKLDRQALPAPDRSRPDLACAFEPAQGETERRVCSVFAALLDLDRVGRLDNFFELGGNSLLAVRLMERLRREPIEPAGTPITTNTIFNHPTPAGLAGALAERNQCTVEPARIAQPVQDCAGDDSDDPIAIIAMAGRFPGAADVEAFWDNLCQGRDSITMFRPEDLDPSVSAADRSDPAYVPARGVIDGVEEFDAAFFGISPKEAELMDPQQRIFLELCWECLERAGHVPDETTTPVGVFAGMCNATYFQRHVAQRSDLIDKIGTFQVMLGNEKDYIATRVAHKLNLTGPAICVQTACSTSLVAICQALQSLRTGQCDMALAGGASVTCPPRSGYRYQEGAMLSPDGRTRTFDARAQGTVFSDGAAVVLLKRLSAARADGNPIYAVLLGGATNNDGGKRASFTAPSSAGQAAVVVMAHEAAKVDARSISYVEAHGTATPLGDPIEIEGLTRAFRRSTEDAGFCRIGSVKSNVGHLVIAAGATGVIKTALSLHEQRIPASIHFESPNPGIDFANSPFVINAAMSAWPVASTPRRAGVSSFGVGGTNAHVVLEEAPARPASDPADGPQLLALSARTPAALCVAASQLADHLQAHPEIHLGDVAWTLAAGRKAFAHRVAILAEDVPAAIAALRHPDTVAAATRSRPARSCDVAFLFPGQGATYPGMGRELYRNEPVFRAAIDECADALTDMDLRERMFSDDPAALLQTAVMQPATFAIEYALARLWMAYGIQPAAMAGHSVGEFVAATLAGIFTVPDAIRLLARRGALMQAQPAGGMLSVRLPLDALQPRLPAALSLAAENAPGACVVAGPLEAIASFQAQLECEGVACRALRTSHAFHSAMMDPVVAPFLAEVTATRRSRPVLPLVSTATGDWLNAETAMSAEYWARHLREPVRFSAALECLLAEPARILLEAGPRATLCGLSRLHPLLQKHPSSAIATLADTPRTEWADFRRAMGQLWCRGAAVDPACFDHRSVRQRLRLPTYPFERQRYWVEAAVAAPSNVVSLPSRPAIVPATALEPVMPQADPALQPDARAPGRRPALVARLKDIFEDVAGFDLADADTDANFIELGLDSLTLTQVAMQLQKAFGVKVTFRQLMAECASLDKLADMIGAQLPAQDTPDTQVAGASSSPTVPEGAVSVPPMTTMSMPSADAGDNFTRQVIAQQMQLMAQQLALLSTGARGADAAASILGGATRAQIAPAVPALAGSERPTAAVPTNSTPTPDADEEAAFSHTTYDVKKAFGAIARIDTRAKCELGARQREKLDAFIARYVARTAKSKQYTQRHRPHMADPRVVNGFRPLLKEIVYQIVIERSKGAHLQDLDGNDYVDALNGFGMSLFGWQPDFVLDAVKQQLELGYEIGPQHPLAGEVAELVCEVTGHDRAALCNTGSEAVLGALRIARTVTGRETIVLFAGAYHGIVDEMIVRGTRQLRAVPAAPGILRNTSEHVLVLDYGTPEAMQVIRERAHEIAAVLVEPVQSRRPDFQPREFLHELRQVTRDAGALLVFDEVVTGFRAHPRGVQGMFDVQADLATYGKVVGGGYPIGVIAGRREFMDALDGGHWQFGDDSFPSVGVTYFAGTFVRHPLALAAAKAVLVHVKEQGGELQSCLNQRVTAMAAEINAFCADHGAPIEVRHFASVWKTFFLEDHPLQDLLFAMMRSRGVHVLDNFPCFLTTAHSDADIECIVDAFKQSVIELQESEFLPRHAATRRTVMDASSPLAAGARLGREPDGSPAWFVPSSESPGKYVKVGG